MDQGNFRIPPTVLSKLINSFGSAFGTTAPAGSTAPKFEVPAVLGGIQTPAASDLAKKAGLASTPDLPVGAADESPALLNHLLNQKEDMVGATQTLAHGLSPHDGVKWAVDACKQVSTKLPPEEHHAVMAADAFAIVPNAANRAVAAEAAAKVGMQSPAGLAAKAASMVDVPDGPPVPGSSKLVPACVAGAVACAAALSAKSPKKSEPPKTQVPKIPVFQVDQPGLNLKQPDVPPPPPGPGSPESARNAQAFKPFIEAGLALAAGSAAVKSRK